MQKSVFEYRIPVVRKLTYKLKTVLVAEFSGQTTKTTIWLKLKISVVLLIL